MQVISNDPTIGLKHPFPSQIQLAIIFSVRMSWGAYRIMLRKSRLHLKNTRYQQAICIVYDSVAEVMPGLFSSFPRSSLSAMKTRQLTFAKILISSGCRVYHQLGYETDENKVLIISSHDFSSVATRKGSTRLKAPGKFHPRSSCSIMIEIHYIQSA